MSLVDTGIAYLRARAGKDGLSVDGRLDPVSEAADAIAKLQADYDWMKGIFRTFRWVSARYAKALREISDANPTSWEGDRAREALDWEPGDIEESDVAKHEVSERERLFVALARYEVDEPHWEEDTTSGYTVDLATLREWLEMDHDGDCTNQPHTCVRCQAEHWWHKAGRLSRALKE